MDNAIGAGVFPTPLYLGEESLQKFFTLRFMLVRATENPHGETMIPLGDDRFYVINNRFDVAGVADEWED